MQKIKGLLLGLYILAGLAGLVWLVPLQDLLAAFMAGLSFGAIAFLIIALENSRRG